MEALRQSLIPRRISRLYADTKRSYEQMIEHSVTNATQTATHTKLRIQKDRLIAWGLEWADTNAAQDGDIDGSLDRAGISDLVGSIMSSILDLLERADSIQQQCTTSYPGAFPTDKPGLTAQPTSQWSTQHLRQLTDIVKDLTTSIDTLCDLSRSRQALSQTRNLQPPATDLDLPPGRSTSKKHVEAQESTNPIQATRIHETQLEIPEHEATPPMSSSPPSYESVAASSEDRVLAFMKTSDGLVPVLLEYVPVIDVVSTGQHQSPIERYMDLMQVQPNVLAGLGPTYLGVLKLRGWVEDTHRARIALVYEVPLPGLYTTFDKRHHPQIFTLLSFLHHGADTDSTNMPSLEDRFRLAFNLASSLLHLHARGLLHKNINSRNIVFFTNHTDTSAETKAWKKGIIRRPFLTSFDQCTEEVCTELEEPFISNIYRHPQYERGRRSRFIPHYDIYSLGLILLEIGLWMPISKLWKTRYTRGNFKSRLQTVYTRKLEGKCGTKYMKVVEFCLKTADAASMTEVLHKPQSGKVNPLAHTQNALYWKAFKVLERCCMIDDFDESIAASDIMDNVFTTQPEKAGGHTQEPVAEVHIFPREVESKFVDVSPSPQTVVQPEQTRQPVEKRKCKCQVWSHEIPAAFVTHWQQSLEPKLNRMFSRIIDRWESYSIELLMAGETPEAAKPTIYMVCASVEKARKVLQYVNQDKGLFDIKVSRGQILRSKAGKKKKRGKGKRAPLSAPVATKIQDKDQPYEHKRYQERPSCGASIGAYLDEQHLPPVSFGGTVLINGEPYGMSVHHMLENDDIDMGLDDSVILQRSMAPADEDDHNVKEDSGHCSSTESPPEALYPYEISDGEDEGYRSATEDDASSDFDPSLWDRDELTDLDNVDMGDTPGVEPGRGDTLLVTQPAIDDVDEGFFPNEEDVDEDHLASHTLGYIHASSGIKRSSRGPISHEIDWALIKIREHRKGHINTIAGGERHCPTTNPSGVVKADNLGGLKVHALGRTSGLQTGTILPSMVMVKMPGRISHSQSWKVAGHFGMGGDSGAWVIDNATGGVCAHMLAWSERCNTAYVAPMEVLFEDMARTLGADVTLPGLQGSLSTKNEASSSDNLAAATASLGISAGAASEFQRGHVGALRGGDPSPIDKRRNRDEANDKQSQTVSHPSLYRETTSSPPVATSPPPSRNSLGPIDSVVTSCLREGKRKGGSERLIEKGEDGFKANFRMNIG
ncbi:MAG: hypothetical protein Q9181_002125 [Wetmoreana brouardii]